MVAAKNGYLGIVELLIKAGAELNTTDSDGHSALALQQHDAWLKEGKTALFHAATNNHTRCVECLLKTGADMYVANRHGSLVLNAVSYTGYKRCVELLIEHGADVNRPDVNGTTPLMSAASSGHISVMQKLLEAGASVNVRDANGSNVLFAAMRSDSNDCVKFLLKSGAYINQVNNYGQNVLQYYVDVSYALSLFRLKLVVTLLFVAGERLENTTVNRYFFNDFDDLVEDDDNDEDNDADVNANGEEIKMLHCLKVEKSDLSLLGLCRAKVREYLIEVDPDLHLFGQVSQLELPTTLQEYLVYNMSLDVPVE